MILQALKEYYDRKPELPREGARAQPYHGRPGGPSLPFHGRARPSGAPPDSTPKERRTIIFYMAVEFAVLAFFKRAYWLRFV